MSASIKTNSRPGSVSKEEAKIKMTLDLRNGIDEIERIVRQDVRLEIAEKLNAIMQRTDSTWEKIPGLVLDFIDELESAE